MKAILPVTILLGLAAGFTRMSGDACLTQGAPAWFGSRSQVLEQLPTDPQDGYGFAVLGDIQQGLEAFQKALRRISQETGADFAVACGDLVNNETEPHYRLLFDAARTADSRVPVLTVPGNHDAPGAYRRLVGPITWERRIGPDLLVGVDNAWGTPSVEDLAALEASLAGEGLRHRFVFLHRPLIRDGEVRPIFRPLLETLERGGATTVFAGHSHHYDRIERNGVLHIANGMGGDISHDMDGDAWLTVVRVGAEGVSDRRINLGKSAEIGSRIRDAFVAHLYAPLRSMRLWSPTVFLLLVLTLLLSQRRWGEAAWLPVTALFFPAFASPPLEALLLAACAVIAAAVVLRVTPRRRPGSTVRLRSLLAASVVVAIWGGLTVGPVYALLLLGSASGWAMATEMGQSPA